ncbi:hypothetical protein NC651_014483 [Populus alba x Populus x berolinensis]|nr:hypothetical protein NC651_014483 [Populus alba x Populus x berolinensis]
MRILALNRKLLQILIFYLPKNPHDQGLAGFFSETSASPESLQESQADELSVVQWVLSLPNRSKEATTNIQIDVVSKEAESYVENNTCGHEDKHSEACLAASMKLPKKLGCFFKLCSSGCKQFSYEDLRRETHHFSSETSLGREGVATCTKDIFLVHKHITPRIGICVEDDHLILVYDFMSKGSLEERLQDKCNSRKSVLPWKVRFKMAIEIAETLNHLHNECPQPVMHRDIKSSNILLSNHFQPQLSDFGLATWGPTDSANAAHNDVVGTFWPAGNAIIIERESKSFAGPEDGQRDFDIVQMQRIVVAATLCVGQTARVRPKIVLTMPIKDLKLELLRGEKGEREWPSFLVLDDDDASPNSVDVSTPSSAGRKSRFML